MRMNTVAQPLLLPEAELVQLIRARLPDAQAVLLYGSFARGEAWPDSDVDLALLAAKPLDSRLRFDIASALADVAGREVDLVDARRIGSDLAIEIVSGARALWVGDAEALLEWELYRLSESSHLHRERRELLDDFHRDGIAVRVRRLP